MQAQHDPHSGRSFTESCVFVRGRAGGKRSSRVVDSCRAVSASEAKVELLTQAEILKKKGKSGNNTVKTFFSLWVNQCNTIELDYVIRWFNLLDLCWPFASITLHLHESCVNANT